jgi:hypothetical protein
MTTTAVLYKKYEFCKIELEWKMDTNEILKLLGEEASKLLEHKCTTIDKELLNLPGFKSDGNHENKSGLERAGKRGAVNFTLTSSVCCAHLFLRLAGTAQPTAKTCIDAMDSCQRRNDKSYLSTFFLRF